MLCNNQIIIKQVVSCGKLKNWICVWFTWQFCASMCCYQTLCLLVDGSKRMTATHDRDDEDTSAFRQFNCTRFLKVK